MQKNDSEKYTDELLYEYWRLMESADRPENTSRMRDIMVELRKRAAEGRPCPNGHRP